MEAVHAESELNTEVARAHDNNNATTTEANCPVFVAFDIGLKNLAACAIDSTGTIYAWRRMPLMDEQRKTKPAQDVLMEALFEHLDELVEELAGKNLIVLIENQPSRINGGMKTIQVWIQTYFALRRHWGESVLSVHLVSPSQKLVGHTHATTGATGTGYKFNKTAAIVLTRAYFAEGAAPKWYAEFNTCKKKDDLADALLHAIAWMRRQGLMVEYVLD
jgi:hypothetical protein